MANFNMLVLGIHTSYTYNIQPGVLYIPFKPLVLWVYFQM